MKKQIVVVLGICCMLFFAGCRAEKLVRGSEGIYYGTVMDRAMSVVNEGDRQGRSYISITMEDGNSTLFWFADGYESDVQIGDYVEIQSAIEEKTNLLIARNITVISAGEK